MQRHKNVDPHTYGVAPGALYGQKLTSLLGDNLISSILRPCHNGENIH